MSDYTPQFYDPLDTRNITAVICHELEAQPLVPLAPEIPKFDGSGLYAIYYAGASEPLYTPLVPHDIPIYVGQSLSHNSATGVATKSRSPLWARVRGHGRSIEGGGLSLTEFAVRLLRMPDVHADLGENGLRVNYQPVWNAVLRGFGSNEQGASTRKSARSKWDTVHQGRNRTYGESDHDRDALIEQAKAHIAARIALVGEVPWR
ncbi:Eco29kI family restriction endonuclease [Nonomuraea glycinis]|uniref:Eco29kI family restriction endonuclease n=1 Tax=Nonomuraea glycinis TaxID=2047744 RepID=UPI00166C0D13|nr:Eco29kI family restriction endonuclease [Nonomuraea glycinis]MCA2180810.1 Eco29kI family restriction endonuclease [Nonomuraea glycinis]